MTLRELMASVQRQSRKSQREIALILGLSPQHFNQKISKGILTLAEAVVMCDSLGLEIVVVDSKDKIVPFDDSPFVSGQGTLRFLDADMLLRCLGYSLEVYDGQAKATLARVVDGFGRRVRAWIDNKDYDTANATAVSTALDCVEKYAAPNKYNVDDPRELYKTADGDYFFAVYAPSAFNDRIELCTEEQAQAFIQEHGYMG